MHAFVQLRRKTRHVMIDVAGLQYREKPPARVVFDISMEGTARKVVTVRSALMIDNQLQDTLDVQLVNPLTNTAGKSSTHSPTLPVTRRHRRRTECLAVGGVGQDEICVVFEKVANIENCFEMILVFRCVYSAHARDQG